MRRRSSAAPSWLVAQFPAPLSGRCRAACFTAAAVLVDTAAAVESVSR
ncbi:hypothetical protein [Streptomyces sp. NPDC047061]